jgi:arabinofuranosyltransferase
MFAMVGAAALTREVYFASLALSGALTLAVVALVGGRISRTEVGALLAISALALSKSFIDYSTSGLENPLTHLLLVAFVITHTTGSSRDRRIALASAWTALLMLNRLDTGLLVLPALAVSCWEAGWRRAARPLLLGMVPLLVWEVFSLVYYGFPFPNTAYSKLAHGVARPELLYQGFLYLLDSIANDPLTPLLISAALLVAAARRRDLAIPAGIALYLAYIVWVGGDFMSGRFLTAPFLLAVLYLLPFAPETFGPPAALLLALIWAAGLAAPRPTVFSNAAYGADIERADAIAATGITDERRYYYPQSGLLNARRGAPMPDHKWLYMGLEARAQGAQVLTTDAAGFIGYAAGPEVYFVDKYGLGDPLIARLPADAPWRIGHFARRVPDGYIETLQSRRNQIASVQVAQYYERLRTITEGPIWSRRRLRTIVEMNLGRFEDLIADYGLVRLSSESLAAVRTTGTPWNASGTVAMTPRGVEVTLPGRTTGRLELSVSGDDRYEVIFLQGGRAVGKRSIAPQLPSNGSLEVRTAEAPGRGGYDALRIRPSGGDARYSIGHLRVIAGDSR